MNEVVDPARIAEVEDLVRRNTTAAYRAPEVRLSSYALIGLSKAVFFPLCMVCSSTSLQQQTVLYADV
jgi:hypothetical protein